MAQTAPSRSRNVNSYVKRQRRYERLAARLAARESALAPLRSKTAAAKALSLAAYAKLTGGQTAEARRLLAPPAEPHNGNGGGNGPA